MTLNIDVGALLLIAVGVLLGYRALALADHLPDGPPYTRQQDAIGFLISLDLALAVFVAAFGVWLFVAELAA